MGTLQFSSRPMSLVAVLFCIFANGILGDLLPRASRPTPDPIVVPASQNFEGNDGPWSSFTVQIGTPAQDVSVFVSTAGYQTWAVLPQGCTAEDPSNCGQLRGGLFRPNQSTSWTPNTRSPYGNGTFALGLEENLDYTGNGEYGYDTVSLGWQGSGGPSLDQQIVAGIATKEFYYGIFGLNPRPTNFTDYTAPAPSYLSNLQNQSKIPSLSWAYTAGNQYRLNKVLGSLTLGGYDASRFVPNNLTIPFNDQDIRDLTVNINSIQISTGNESKLTQALNSGSISAFVDSTTPYIYLPLEACEQFEAAFGITWNDNAQAYLVNDSLHDSLQALNAKVDFVISNSSDATKSDNLAIITLPYAAFDLVAEYPLAENSTRYFPLVRATNESQYSLGRTFFQEAYIIADYERRNFSISQCSWVEGAKQDIVPILSPGQHDPPKKANIGLIVGMVITGVCILLALSLALFWWRRRVKRIREDKGLTTDSKTPELEDGSPKAKEHHEIEGKGHLGTEIDGKGVFEEMDGSPLPGYERGKELEGDHGAQEMNAKETPAHELDVKEMPATELPA